MHSSPFAHRSSRCVIMDELDAKVTDWIPTNPVSAQLVRPSFATAFQAANWTLSIPLWMASAQLYTGRQHSTRRIAQQCAELHCPWLSFVLLRPRSRNLRANEYFGSRKQAWMRDSFRCQGQSSLNGTRGGHAIQQKRFRRPRLRRCLNGNTIPTWRRLFRCLRCNMVYDATLSLACISIETYCRSYDEVQASPLSQGCLP